MWATVLLQAGAWARNLQTILSANIFIVSWGITCVRWNEMHLVGGGHRKAQATRKRQSRRLKPSGWSAFPQEQLFYGKNLVFCRATSSDLQQRGNSQPGCAPLPIQAKDGGSRPSAMGRTYTKSLSQPCCILQPPCPMTEAFPTHTSG